MFLNGLGILVAASLTLALILRIIVWLARRKPKRYWRSVLLLHVFVLVPLYVFVVLPGGFGYMVTHQTRTRGDESSYAGPRITEQGVWISQTRASLRQDEAHPEAIDPTLLAAATARHRTFLTTDGVYVGGYLVEPTEEARRSQPPLSVVLVHGFFRGALEIEPVGQMFRDAGCEVFLLEMRSHGKSDRKPFSFGARESLDVLAACSFLHARDGHANDPILLFGVSLGAAAVALAAPHVDHLAGMMLDAPTDSMSATIHRIIGSKQSGAKRLRSTLALPPPIPWLIMKSVEFWGASHPADVRPIDAVRQLPIGVPVTIIGGGQDQRMPPDVVTEVFDALVTTNKKLWILEEAGHGKVWEVDPEGYRAHVLELVKRARQAE